MAGSDQIRDLWVTCPWASEKIPIDLKWEICCDLSSAFNFKWIFFILAGNKVNHKSLDGYEFRQDSITDLGVSCPWVSEKSMNNVVTTLGPSFLIGSSSFLQVTRTTIKSVMGSKFGQIIPLTVELAALERLGNPHRLIMGDLLWPL